MGRQKQNPTGTFTLRSGRTKSEDGIIYLRYFVCGKYVDCSTNIKIPVKHWDARNQRVLSANKNWSILNSRLYSLKTKYDNQIMSYNGHISSRMVSQILHGEYVEKDELPYKTDFIQYCQDYNKMRFDLGKISFSTYDNGRLYIIQFQKWLKEHKSCDTLPISQLSPSLFNDYISWRLNTKNNTKEGVNKTLTPLFKGIKYASDNELLSASLANTICVYLDFKNRTYGTNTQTNKVKYLTPEQITLFCKIQPTLPHERTREIMDMFLFAFHSCGLRISDILTLEWKHIDFERKIIDKIIFKTKTRMQIPLTEPAIKILEKWKLMKRNDRFVFDLLPIDFNINDEKSLKNARLSKNRTIRQSLWSVGQKLGLSFNLSFHVARHTFAVIAIKRGVDLYLLSKLLGHKSITVTEKVYADYLPKDIKNIVRENLSFDFVNV